MLLQRWHSFISRCWIKASYQSNTIQGIKMLSSFNTTIVLRSGEDEKIYIPKIYIPKCSLIGFYSSKEISIVALFVSLTASIFLLSTSFRILFFSWSFSFSCSSISPLSSDFSEFYPRASKCFPHASQL